MDKKNLYIIIGVLAVVVVTLGASLHYEKKGKRDGWNRRGPGMEERKGPGPDGAKEAMKPPQEEAPKAQLATIDLKAAEGAGPVEDGTYTVLGAESRMNWEARKPLVPGGYVDKGIVNISEGSFIMKDGKAVAGNVVIDMSTIGAASTGKGRGESMLTNHLKSKDFFDVATYPTASFALKEAIPAADVATSHRYTLKGDLTVKDKTNEVSMDAVIAYTKDGLLHAVARAELDRTKWDIRYGSGKFFDNLADKVIDDMFTVTFELVAKKQ